MVVVRLDQSIFSEFNVYPNPSPSFEPIQLHLTAAEDQEVLVVVYDVTGKNYYSKILITKTSGENIFALDVNHKLISGMYYIAATTNNKIYGRKMVIE